MESCSSLREQWTQVSWVKNLKKIPLKSRKFISPRVWDKNEGTLPSRILNPSSRGRKMIENNPAVPKDSPFAQSILFEINERNKEADYYPPHAKTTNLDIWTRSDSKDTRDDCSSGRPWAWSIMLGIFQRPQLALFIRVKWKSWLSRITVKDHPAPSRSSSLLFDFWPSTLSDNSLNLERVRAVQITPGKRGVCRSVSKRIDEFGVEVEGFARLLACSCQRVANSSSSEKQNNDEFLFLVPRYELSLSARDFFTVASLFYLLAQILCFPDFSLFNLRCNLRR